MLHETAQLLKTPEGQIHYPEFENRLQALKQKASDIAWGYGSDVKEVVDDLETVFPREEA